MLQSDTLRNALALSKFVGQAPAFVRAVERLPGIAQSDRPVLVRGETGTGKELAARALHYLSPRAPFPFVAVNCGALPETLLEDELFGHERGAFTDARAPRPGVIAEAERGTLFLDEVDSLPPKAQVSLLRVLQEGRYRALGGSAELPANVRIVAACNAPLEQRTRDGDFRVDLYYRLAVFTVALPPLRERHEDILRLAEHFLHKHTSPGRATPALSEHARSALLAHDWPGNIRELENVILRAGHFCRNGCIDPEDLGLPAAAENTAGPSGERLPLAVARRQAVGGFEREYLLRLLAECRGNVTHAAKAASTERRSLGKLLKRHGIDPRAFRTP